MSNERKVCINEGTIKKGNTSPPPTQNRPAAPSGQGPKGCPMKETIVYQLAEGYYSSYDYIFREVTEEILRDFFCGPNANESFYGSVGLWSLDDEDYIVNVCLTKGEKDYTLIVTDNTGDTTDYELLPVKLIGE